MIHTVIADIQTDVGAVVFDKEAGLTQIVFVFFINEVLSLQINATPSLIEPKDSNIEDMLSTHKSIRLWVVGADDDSSLSLQQEIFTDDDNFAHDCIMTVDNTDIIKSIRLLLNIDEEKDVLLTDIHYIFTFTYQIYAYITYG